MVIIRTIITTYQCNFSHTMPYVTLRLCVCVCEGEAEDFGKVNRSSK